MILETLQDHIFYSPRTLKLLARWTALEAKSSSFWWVGGRFGFNRKKGDEKIRQNPDHLRKGRFFLLQGVVIITYQSFGFFRMIFPQTKNGIIIRIVTRLIQTLLLVDCQMLRILVITCPLRPSLRRQFEATLFFPRQNNCMTYFRNDISHHLSKKKYSVWHTSIGHWDP